MTWIRLDTSLPEHPKVLAAGPRAAWLFVCSICWSARVGTDGFVPRAALNALSTDSKRRLADARRLVAVQLWEECGTAEGQQEDGSATGWRIHDFKEWQRTKDENRASSRENRANGEAEIAHLRARAGAQGRAQGRDARGDRGEREERGTPLGPPRGGIPIPSYPVGGRQREQQAFREACAAYAVEHGIAEGSRAVQQAIHYGHAETLEQVEAFIAQHWSSEK